VYVTRHRHVEKLLLLKRFHPDLHLTQELEDSGTAIEELSPSEFGGFMRTLKIEQFGRTTRGLEDEWQ